MYNHKNSAIVCIHQYSLKIKKKYLFDKYFWIPQKENYFIGNKGYS